MFFIVPWKKSIDKICTTYAHLVYDFSNWRLPRKKGKLTSCSFHFALPCVPGLCFVLGSTSNIHPFKEYSLNTLLPKCTCVRTYVHVYTVTSAGNKVKCVTLKSLKHLSHKTNLLRNYVNFFRCTMKDGLHFEGHMCQYLIQVDSKYKKVI